MDDTVSRAAAIDAMSELMRHWFGGDPKDEVKEIKRELEKLPTVQTCEDAVSRQAVIDELEKAMCEDGFRSVTGLIHKTTAYDIIRHLPSAQPEQTKMIKEIRKWINSGNRGSADYFIVDKIEEIINKYE